MQDKTKAILSHGLVILNLLFPIVYIYIFISWIKNRNSKSELLRISIKEAFVLASISTIIFVCLVTAVLMHYGFKSSFTLIAGEIYYMFLVPLFFVPAILGISKNNANQVYFYPLIGRFIK